MPSCLLPSSSKLFHGGRHRREVPRFLLTTYHRTMRTRCFLLPLPSSTHLLLYVGTIYCLLEFVPVNGRHHRRKARTAAGAPEGDAAAKKKTHSSNQYQVTRTKYQVPGSNTAGHKCKLLETVGTRNCFAIQPRSK